MKLLKDCAFLLIGLVLTTVLLPLQAYATTPPNGVPEPVSLALPLSVLPEWVPPRGFAGGRTNKQRHRSAEDGRMASLTTLGSR